MTDFPEYDEPCVPQNMFSSINIHPSEGKLLNINPTGLDDLKITDIPTPETKTEELKIDDINPLKSKIVHKDINDVNKELLKFKDGKINPDVDYLLADVKDAKCPFKFACVSMLSPDHPTQKSNIARINIRGGAVSIEKANAFAKKLNKAKKSNKHNKRRVNIYNVPMNVWIPWYTDGSYPGDELALKELNMLVGTLIYNKLKEDKEFIERKERMKKMDKEMKAEIKTEVPEDKIKEFEKYKEDANASDSEKEDDVLDYDSDDEAKKIKEKYGTHAISLKNDKVIADQQWSVITFASLDEFKVKGFKVRGIYEKKEDAIDRAKFLQKIDGYFHNFPDKVGQWKNAFQNPDDAEHQEYYEQGMQDLYVGHKEAQKKSKDLKENVRIEKRIAKQKKLFGLEDNID